MQGTFETWIEQGNMEMNTMGVIASYALAMPLDLRVNNNRKNSETVIRLPG